MNFKVGDIRIHKNNPNILYTILSIDGYKCKYTSNVISKLIIYTSIDAMKRYTRKLTKLEKALQ